MRIYVRVKVKVKSPGNKRGACSKCCECLFLLVSEGLTDDVQLAMLTI